MASASLGAPGHPAGERGHPSSKVLVYYSPVFLGHDTGEHPENAGRLTGIMGRLEKSDLRPRMELITPRRATREEVLAVHSPRHLEFIRAACEAGGGALDSDNVLSRGSMDAALHAAGAAAEAVEAVLRGPVTAAFAAVRPPGHHARPASVMGFCLLNSAAVAAAKARFQGGQERVAVLDVDVHHGNGTQEIFYEDPEVLYVSLHKHPLWPPGSGSRDEKGRGRGLGANLNLPLPWETTPRDYLGALDLALDRILAFKPGLILVSAGFDTYRADPVSEGGLNLESEHYLEIGRRIRRAAGEVCGGRTVSLLEGGYNLEALPGLVENYLRGIMG